MRVPEVIAAYRQAIAEDDRAVARDWLEKLEGEAYRNEADWALIRPFFQKEGLHGRLQLVTNALIKRGAAKTGQPYFVLAGLYLRSGQLDEAVPLIAQYRKLKPEAPVKDWNADSWDFVNLLLEAHLYEDCLIEIRAMLKASPDEFQYLITEARVLGKLRDTKAGLKKLKALKPMLGRDGGRWEAYADVAFALGDDLLGQAAVGKLIELLEKNEGRLNWYGSHIMKRNGYAADLTRLVFAADPKIYTGIPDLTYVFDVAQEVGAAKTAARFGNAILALGPDEKLRDRIDRFLAEPGFLMA